MAVRPETPEVGEAWLAELEEHRRPPTGYCYRMLGSAFEAVQVIDVAGGKIVGHHHFLDTDLFAFFGLPPRLDP